ncbi:GNAT family N-acetyltransferase [Pseudomonadota bacterium]
MALPDSNRLIGKFVLFQFSEQNRRAEVGYILNRRHWGQGYMSEVMSCVLDYAFDVINPQRSYCVNDQKEKKNQLQKHQHEIAISRGLYGQHRSNHNIHGTEQVNREDQVRQVIDIPVENLQ